MATIDLQAAYRAVPILPDNRKSFGLVWDFGDGPINMQDNFLCFGTKIAPFIFSRLTDSISRHMLAKGYVCYNYLDDFIVIGSSYQNTCDAQLYLISLLRRLGFYISWPKVTSPSTNCRYLGIEINSVHQTLSLPSDKMNNLSNELAFWEHRTTATKKEMQKLCGILNYCCKVIRGGRVFMHYMISLLKCFNTVNRIKLPLSFFEDLEWWRSYSEIFNGKADFINPELSTHSIDTDACLQGIAGVFNNDFFQGCVGISDSDCFEVYPITDNLYNVLVPIEHVSNINILELLAVYVALCRWYYNFNNSRLLVNCDNLQVCYMLAKDRSSNTLANECLKSIFWLCVKQNMYISPCYRPSSANIIADYLSRTVYL